MTNDPSICDRCSAELDEDDDILDGPIGSEYEGCTVCARCLGEIEEEGE